MLLKAFLKQNMPFRVKYFFSNFKYYSRWRSSQAKSRSSLGDQSPWLTFRAIDFLSDFIKPGMRVFEYGSGGSSLFFLNKGCELVSVEHDKEWYRQVIALAEGKKSWEIRFIPPEKNEPGVTLDISDPGHYASGGEEFANHHFKSYCTYIEHFPDSHFHIILIDGRARTSCIKHCISKIKPGGLMIIDQAERSYYFPKNAVALKQFRKLIYGISPLPYDIGFTNTSIWEKKSET